MSMTFTTTGIQSAQDAIKQALEGFRGGKAVLVGIHEEAGNIEDGSMTMAGLGATHEFGADVDHPGGTPYGYATRDAAERGEVRFLGKGKGFMELGVTEAHKVTIPARPWLVPGVASATKEIVEAIDAQVKRGASLDDTLNIIGVVAVGSVKQYMTDLKTPPNAASTVKKKGTDNPLIETGAMRASVTHSITGEKLQEGI